MKLRRVLLFSLILTVSASIATARFNDIFETLGFGKQPGTDKIISGLKQALCVGTDTAAKISPYVLFAFLVETIFYISSIWLQNRTLILSVFLYKPYFVKIA